MASAAAPQSLSAEDEALKRNTDCVYFLASPLTCKKGNECEYRHSDVARMNPRDCWYWLHGSCLNPKCAFRHPPLDGLLGTQMQTSSGPTLPQSQTVTTPTTHIPDPSIKQGVPPCKFFQSGFCMKGDWCPFLHAPYPSVEPATFKKAFGGFEKPPQEKVVPPVNVPKKPVQDSTIAPPAVKTVPAPRRNELDVVNKRISLSRSVHQPEQFLDNGKDEGEISREPSPGFDVLVDDEYGMPREREVGNEYNDMGRSITDYNVIADIDNERYQEESLGYDDSRGGQHRRGQYGSDQHRGSSSYLERRRPHDNNRGQIDELDLRHRLAKHKNPNNGNLRSVISHDSHGREKHVEHRSYYQGSRRDENSNSLISSRLRGRIRLPERSSSPTERRPDLRLGRIQDRIRAPSSSNTTNGWRNHRGESTNANFSGPRSLSELKNKNNAEPLGKRKYSMHDGHQQESADDLSFRGPKPLEEILKRKRGGIVADIGHQHRNEDIIEDNNNNNQIVSSVGKNEEIDNNAAVASKLEDEDGKIAEFGEDQELDEAYGSDYEQVGGEDVELYDGEGGEEEYVDEDDEDEDDDFAKKMGVMYS